jgi:hypothetical protein
MAIFSNSPMLAVGGLENRPCDGRRTRKSQKARRRAREITERHTLKRRPKKGPSLNSSKRKLLPLRLLNRKPQPSAHQGPSMEPVLRLSDVPPIIADSLHVAVGCSYGSLR